MRIKTWTLWLLDFADHFDLYVYSCLSPLIGALFFPSTPLVEVLLAYSVFWTSSIIAYPLGTAVFGVLAARFSPAIALRWAALGLSVFTVMMGLLPPYHAVGIIAPVLLLIIRTLQYSFACGERIITRLYLVNDQPVRKAIASSVIYDLFTVSGLLCASGVASAILFANTPHLWRLPFVISGALSFIAFMNRKLFKENVHKQAKPTFSKPPLSLILECMAVSGLSYVPYALIFQFLNAFIPQISSVPHGGMMLTNTAFLGVDMGLLVIFGMALRCTQNPRALWKLMIVSASILLVTGLPLFLCIPMLLAWNKLYLLQLWLTMWGILYALPLMAWLRYFGKGPYQYFHLGMGIALGQIVIGHGTAFFCLLLYKVTGWIGAPGIYLCFACLLALWGQKRLISRMNNQAIISRDNMRG